MLTASQIDALRSQSEQLLDPITDFLIEDIAKRVAQAGQFTATASYDAWKLQQLGVSQKQLKKEIAKRLGVSMEDAEKLLTQAAKTGYNFDMSRFLTSHAIPLSANSSLQQILDATVKLARDDLTNIVNTMGFVGPDGQCRELTDAYVQACDFAFQKVSTGAQDYTSAIRDAIRNLAEKGIRSIDYKSGYHTSIEAAVRQNLMGGMGLMQEQISQSNHDLLGCDGWEISAHMASAPDHEPHQGRQFRDQEYERLNNSLVRRIGTLSCGHSETPIIYGVTPPQYTEEELEEMRRKNAEGVIIDGKHYTLYEATQRQRKFERTIRKQKRRILVDEATEDADKLQTDQIKLVRLRQEYARFSKGVGLPMQHARMETAGFDWKKGKAAEKAAKQRKASMSAAFDDTRKKINWPSRGENITMEEYQYLSAYAKSKGIQLQGLRKSDVDVELFQEVIDTADVMLRKYPELRGTEKRPFTIKLESMDSVDFAEVLRESPHVLRLNRDAVRSKGALESEYAALVEAGRFVKGTGYASIVHHEMGHMVSDVYGIDGAQVMKEVLGTSRTGALLWCHENLSEYSFELNGEEIISEAFASFYGSNSPSKEIVDFVSRCDNIILEWRRLR